MPGKITHHTDQLIGQNKAGRPTYWQGFVFIEEQGGVFTYSTTSEMLASGEIGNRKRSALYGVTGKNVGRSNETTAEEQALFNLGSDQRKLQDLGHVAQGQARDIPVLPMLAENYKNRTNTIKFPCALQPKLNGLRMICDNDYRFKYWSRHGKPFSAEVLRHLEFDAPFVLDGELLLPPKYKLQEIMSVSKKFYGEDHDPNSGMLEYCLFDIIDRPDMPFRERYDALSRWYNDHHQLSAQGIYLVPTYECTGPEDVESRFNKIVAAGYEGVMLRNWDSTYLPGYYGLRSTDLMKLKPMEDAEFEIVGVVDGNGRELGAIMYVCKTSGGAEFTVRPEGPVEERKKLWKGGYKPVGKMLTVRFQELTAEGVPQFPVGVTVQDGGGT